MKPLIVNMTEGRGKTGKAKHGNVRMMFIDNDDHETFYNFLMRCRQVVIDRDGGDALVASPRDYFDASCKNLFSKKFDHVYELKAGHGQFIYLVNRDRLNPQINIEREIEKMHEQNCCEVAS